MESKNSRRGDKMFTQGGWPGRIVGEKRGSDEDPARRPYVETGENVEQDELRARSASALRWARLALWFGLASILSGPFFGTLEWVAGEIELLDPAELIFDALTSLAVFAMLPLGIAAIVCGKLAGMRLPRELQPKKVRKMRLAGMVLGILVTAGMIGAFVCSAFFATAGRG